MLRLRFDRHALLLALVASLPPLAATTLLLWTGVYSAKVRWTVLLLLATTTAGALAALRAHIVSPLQTLANLVAALREDDFSIRGHSSTAGDPLGDVMAEVNALAETLHEQRLGAVEATALLRTVMEQIDVAVFAFDPGRTLRLVNRTGERLLGRPAEQLLGRTADALELAGWLGDAPGVVTLDLPGGSGRWDVRRTTFRLGGLRHDLLVVSDVSRPLREEERQAWQRLIRVIGHELGNSLGPIKSIAGSLDALLLRDPAPPDLSDDLRRGLQVIGSRADALSRFTGAYAQLAKLPPPRRAPLVLKPLVQRVAGLESRVPAVHRLVRGRGAGRPAGDDGTDDDTPKFFHYVKKNKIAESAVMGTHVVALCGEVFPVTRSPKAGAPVCPDCKRIYEGMPAGGGDDKDGS